MKTVAAAACLLVALAITTSGQVLGPFGSITPGLTPIVFPIPEEEEPSHCEPQLSITDLDQWHDIFSHLDLYKSLWFEASRLCQGQDCCKNLCDCCECQQDCEYTMVTTDEGKMVYFVDHCMHWVEAQKFCREHFLGMLWEPRDLAEYTQVRDLIFQKIPAFCDIACQWWIGFLNLDDSNERDAYYASNHQLAGWMQVTDGNDQATQQCVKIHKHDWRWGDEHCICTRMRFICEGFD